MEHTPDFADVIRQKLAADPELAVEVAEQTVNAQIASQILQAREAAGLTQSELAERAKTSQSVIARIEDADYDGHSVKLLQRVAEAMNLMLRVEFYPKPDHIIRDFESDDIFETSISEIEWPVRAPQSQEDWANLQISSTFAIGAKA